MIDHDFSARIYFDQTDAGGVVYHAAYLALAEHARTEALREAGLPHGRLMAEHGVSFMVRRIILDYRRPAKLDDLLRIRTISEAQGGATLVLKQQFWRDDEKLVDLGVTLACVNLATGQPARIPAAWRALHAA
jgi:acyl-CoA thioester hydrolase